MGGPRMGRCGAALAMAGLLGGCAQITPNFAHQREAEEQVSFVDSHSSFPAVRRADFEQINLVELVDPHGRARDHFRGAWDAVEQGTVDRRWGRRYDLVLAWFRENTEQSAQDKLTQRNAVQDKILAVSTSRCNVFKTFLRRQQSDVNFQLGSATTAAGVLGAVLPGVRASRNLAAAAGLFSGLQAEYNTSYYSNLTAHVIVQAIEIRQARLKAELMRARADKPVAEYTLESAINDALVIDGSCSTVAGLLEAADSIKEVTNPGLTRAAEVIASVRMAGEIAQADKVSDLAASGVLDTLLKRVSTGSSTLVATLARPDAPGGALDKEMADAGRAGQRIRALVTEAGEGIARAFDSAQAKLDKAERAQADLTANKARQVFEAQATRAVKALPVDACVAGLAAPAGTLAQARVRLPLAADGPARLVAEESLAQASASARTAAGRVKLLVDSAMRIIHAGEAAAQGLLGKAQLTELDLGRITFPAPDAGLTTLCPGSAG
jgi:hypothetical protein